MAETLKLDNKNFFSAVEKESPAAFTVFQTELENFKTKTKWADLFIDNSIGPDGVLKSGVQFTDIPYALQRGFLGIFFAGMDILVYVNPSNSKKKGFSWMVIDTQTAHMTKSFLDASQSDETVFSSFIQCEIDALRSAFLVLNERIDDTKVDKTTPDQLN